MTDDGLRATERALVTAPADLELRRRHARQLQRAGAPAERTLAALDLAWRLGADEVWDELQAGVAGRALRLDPLELRYVPAGPFVLGGDDGDEDEAPARLVELSAFHMAARPVTRASVQGTRLWADWMRNMAEYPVDATLFEFAGTAVEAVAARAKAGGLHGRVSLASEAQWERVARASLLRPDGENPYGVVFTPMLEWTADTYQPDAFVHAAAKDPVEARPSELRVVRGPPLAEPHHARYREAAALDGQFVVENAGAGLLRRTLGLGRTYAVRAEEGLAVRVVLA